AAPRTNRWTLQGSRRLNRSIRSGKIAGSFGSTEKKQSTVSSDRSCRADRPLLRGTRARGRGLLDHLHDLLRRRIDEQNPVLQFSKLEIQGLRNEANRVARQFLEFQRSRNLGADLSAESLRRRLALFNTHANHDGL